MKKAAPDRRAASGGQRRGFFASLAAAGALLFMAALLLLTEPPRVLCALLAAAAIHEAGHAAALAACGVSLRTLRFQPFGLRLETGARLCGYGKEAFICLAGIGANLLTGAAALFFLRFAVLREWLFCFALFSAGLAAFNLLPLPGTDGTGALSALLCAICREEASAYRAVNAVTGVFTVLLWGVCLAALLGGYAVLYPFLLSVFFLAGACGQQN